MLKRAYQLYLKFTPMLILVALFLGVALAKYIPAVMNIANFLISNLIDGIVFAAPIAIFVILAPSLAKMMKARKESSFAGFVVLWFGLTRIAAGAWAALFTVIILGFPMLPSAEAGTVSVGSLIAQNFAVLKDLMLHSVFFGAIWLSIVVGVIAYHKKKLYNALQKAAGTVETLGDYIEPAIPVLMLILGAYIYGLPGELAASVDAETMAAIGAAEIGKLTIFGWTLDVNTEFGLVWIYVVGSVLIGVGCFIWQAMQLCVVKRYIPNFSVKRFFADYWMKVYPLAWCTSSEVISMPLNMALIKRGYKDIHRIVRRLVVGLGAYMNINGTTMHVILLGGIVAAMVGYTPSFFQLLLGVPLIALIGYGVPGIPGELVLFAVPMVKILNLPEETIPLFMALYLALQVGLPDSFRTGANVTDNGIYAIGLNKLYRDKFASDGDDTDEAVTEDAPDYAAEVERLIHDEELVEEVV